MYVYCLFCHALRCSRIAQLLEIRGIDRAFSPKILSYQWKQGIRQTRKVDLLPGYIFIYHSKRITTFDLFAGIDGIVRRVGRTETGYELAGPDLVFALKLFERDGQVDAMTLIKKNKVMYLEDPLFNENESTVTKIDYRKQRARVDFTFENSPVHAWISLKEIKNGGDVSTPS